MKSIDQIISEVKRNDFLKDEVIDENNRHVKDAVDFYERYPQYENLTANSIFFIRGSIRTKKKPVKVYRFKTDNSLWFVGDIITAKNAPIASIGEGMTLPPGVSWEEGLKDYSTIVEEIFY